MKTFISNSEISSGVGTTSEIWENIFSKKEWGKYPSEAVIRFIARNFYNAPNRNEIQILELGLGTGANLWFCAREGLRVSGVEFSQSGIERFLQRMSAENLSAQIDKIVQGDYFEKLDEFDGECFDAFIDSYSLAYNDIDRSKAIIEKAVKKLKSGGKFLSITPSVKDEGFDEKANLGYHRSKPVVGSDAFTGLIRYCDESDIHKLYNGTNYAITSLKSITQHQNGKIENDLFIVEGVKK